MQYNFWIRIYSALLAITFPTIAAQPVRTFRLPSLAAVPAPASVSLPYIEDPARELPEGSAFGLAPFVAQFL
jgi:hypothetical protein